MEQSFVNKLIKKAKEKERSIFLKSTKELKKTYTVEEYRMRNNIARYCDDIMPQLEKKLFEFRLRTEQMEEYLENIKKQNL